MKNILSYSVTKIIVAINCIVFLFTFLNPNLFPLLAFNSDAPFNVLTYITSMFVHANLIHLAFNMITLWSFGEHLEKLLGKQRFLILYFVSGIIGSLLWVSLYFGDPISACGASGALFGVITAFAMVYPQFKVLFFFIIPAKIKILMQIIIPLSILCFLTGWLSGIGHMAHVGGAVGGYLYMQLVLGGKKNHWGTRDKK
jgi:membrane associated rhomboid family serine protease